MTIVDQLKEREEKEKEEVIDLLREQMKVEGQLVGCARASIVMMGTVTASRLSGRSSRIISDDG